MNAQSERTFEEEVQDLAQGDSDSLVDFFSGLSQLSGKFRQIVRVSSDDPPVQMFIHNGLDEITLNYDYVSRECLTRQEMERYAQDRDCDNSVNVAVYDLLDSAWRGVNGQDVGGVEVTLI